MRSRASGPAHRLEGRPGADSLVPNPFPNSGGAGSRTATAKSLWFPSARPTRPVWRNTFQAGSVRSGGSPSAVKSARRTSRRFIRGTVPVRRSSESGQAFSRPSQISVRRKALKIPSETIVCRPGWAVRAISSTAAATGVGAVAP